MGKHAVGAVSGNIAGDTDRLALLEDFINKWRKGVFNDAEVKRILKKERNPFDAPVIKSFREQFVLNTAKLLSKHFGRKVKVDPLPEILTEENIRKAAEFNLRPVFSPGKEIFVGRKPKNWVALPEKFFQWERDKKIATGSAIWPCGWYLADFSIGADYTDGTQVFCDDPLSPLIEKLRKDGKVGKYDKTPMGSRFAIMPNSEWPLVFTELANELEFFAAKQVSLEPYSVFNAIGNIYDKNRGKFNMWEWFADIFGDSSRLYGGDRGHGGLARVDCSWVGFRYDIIAGRPLVSFK